MITVVTSADQGPIYKPQPMAALTIFTSEMDVPDASAGCQHQLRLEGGMGNERRTLLLELPRQLRRVPCNYFKVHLSAFVTSFL